jgi:Uncharacterised nucleotidyltransferase
MAIPEHTRDAERIRRLVFDAVAVRAMRQVLDVARTAGVSIAPVKGVVLARRLYEHVFDRPYVDVDFLVSRSGFGRMTSAVEAQGWSISYKSGDLGDLHFFVEGVPIEVHAEFCRRDLSLLSSEEVLSRAVQDGTTFAFDILRLDDIDHLLLLVANVIRKAFLYANVHQPADLELFLRSLKPRWAELVQRAILARFATALRSVSEWMIEEHGSELFGQFVRLLPRGRQPVSIALQLYRKLAARQTKRLNSTSGLLGLALATLTPDDPFLRAKGIARVIHRGYSRRRGRDPG